MIIYAPFHDNFNAYCSDSIQYEQGLSDQFEEDLENSFDELEVGLQRMIRVRIEIRDRHREDMLKIAERLDDHKRSVHISKAVGLFAAIGGMSLY